VSPTVAKWFVSDARETVDSVYRFEPLRDGNILRPGEDALCNGLQGSSRGELRWMAE
jgi:hypothetical protein